MSSDNINTNNGWLREKESKRQHLEFIQNVITRMNSNSFQIKGFAILIVTALLGVYAANENVMTIFIGIVPTLACWFLDARYLQMERQFIGLYEGVVKGAVEDYGMNFEAYDFRVDCKYCYFNVLFLEQTMWLYPCLAILLGGIGGFLCYGVEI